MAIDTKEKRKSIMGFAIGVNSYMPDPDGDIDNEADRIQLLGQYAGSDFGAPEIGSGSLLTLGIG